MQASLDAESIHRWIHAAADALGKRRAEIDELNVFPVPDADTGTNMEQTVRAAADALATTPVVSTAQALRTVASGAILGARGNSGVILAQLLRGFADAAHDAERWGPDQLRDGLQLGAQDATAAVAEPVDGTILTVAHAAAAAARGPGSMAELITSAVDAADQALSRTPTQLAALARAGVVDAGGLGLVVVLAALAEVIVGAPIRLTVRNRLTRPAALLQGEREGGSSEFGYEVQYLLDAPAVRDAQITELREELARLGDSVVVVGTGDGIWNVHVHTNDVGAALETGLQVGRPYRVTVISFADRDPAPTGTGVAVVAIAPGRGLSHLFQAEGVYVVDGGRTGRPTVDEVTAVVQATGAANIVLLPNAAKANGIAEAAADAVRAQGLTITVVPTRSPVQSLAAIAVHDSARRFDDDVVAMAEAAAATRFAEITVAKAESLTSVGICQAGDVLGLIDGEVVEIGRGLVAVAFSLTDRLLAVGAELITVLVGEHAPGGVGEVIARHVRERAPLTEVCVYSGGQLDHPLIIGVE
ncbi:MAG: DAK2 domain-containing protein [Jatrophihabitantaceae bacterium]